MLKTTEHNVPAHVAIIMDGNGRWAKRRGMPRSFGHKAGADALKDIVRAADARGIRFLSVYGFSTENWKRPAAEVKLLMSLIREYLLKHVQEMHAEGVRIRFLGDIEGLPAALHPVIREAEELTKDNAGITLQLALNYGGRDDILRAVKKVAREAAGGLLDAASLTEDAFGSMLYTKDCPDVDLLIRPGRDFRISNFLLWQIAYAELWFTDTYWPDFTADTLDDALAAFRSRERRFGGLDAEG